LAGAGESVELYAAWCQRQWGEGDPRLADHIRDNVRLVRVGPPASKASADPPPANPGQSP
jgi:hypothetical protein